MNRKQEFKLVHFKEKMNLLEKDINELKGEIDVNRESLKASANIIEELKDKVITIDSDRIKDKNVCLRGIWNIGDVLREFRRDMPNLLEFIANNFQHVPDFNKGTLIQWQQHFLKKQLEGDSNWSEEFTPKDIKEAIEMIEKEKKIPK